MKKLLVLCLLVFSFGFAADFLNSEDFKSFSQKEQEIIQAVVKKEEVSEFLGKITNWSLYIEVEGYWSISFFDSGEWIGYILYDEASDNIKTNELPELLSQKEIAAYEEKIERYLFDDPEIKALISNANEFSKGLEYRKYENYWSYYLSNGLDGFEIVIIPDGEDYFYIDEIRNYNAIDADRQMEIDRDKAIELAYSSPKIDEVFAEVDDWFSYAEIYKDNSWIVEFAAQGKTLLSVLVDIDKGIVLESNLP